MIRGFIGKKILLFFVFILIFSIFDSPFSSAQGSIESDSSVIKITIKEGDTINKRIKLSSDTDSEYSLELVNLPFAKLSDNKLFFENKNSETISVDFNSSSLSPKVYVGGLKISKVGDVSLIPIIFEVESKDVFFDLNLEVPPQYSKLAPGSKFTTQLKIYDLTSGGTTEGLGSVSVDVFYYIYGLDGTLFTSESEKVVISRQVQLLKTMSLSQDMPDGDYIFTVIVKYGESTGISTYLFTISRSASNGSTQISTELFYIFFSVFILLFALFLLFIYLIVRNKDKHITELERYNRTELIAQKSLLAEQEKIILEKGSCPVEQIKKEADEKISALKEEHEERIQHVHKLKQEGSVAEVERKIREWKRDKSRIFSNSRLSGLSAKDMKSIEGKFIRK